MRSAVFMLAAAASTAMAANIPSILPITPPDNTLIVTYGDITMQNPGRVLMQSDTLQPPVVSLPANAPIDLFLQQYILIMVDPSVNTTDPSNVYLHEIITNMLPLPNNGTLNGNAPAPLAPYVNPQPPAGLTRHAYTLLLFVQPAEYRIPPQYDAFFPYPSGDLLARENFPLLDFIAALGLGDPIAANYFLEGATTNSTTSTATATVSALTTSTTSTTVIRTVTASSAPNSRMPVMRSSSTASSTSSSSTGTGSSSSSATSTGSSSSSAASSSGSTSTSSSATSGSGTTSTSATTTLLTTTASSGTSSTSSTSSTTPSTTPGSGSPFTTPSTGAAGRLHALLLPALLLLGAAALL